MIVIDALQSSGNATPTVGSPIFYDDVNGDGTISALDVLWIINDLQNATKQAAHASAAPSAVTASVAASRVNAAGMAASTASSGSNTPSVTSSVAVDRAILELSNEQQQLATTSAGSLSSTGSSPATTASTNAAPASNPLSTLSVRSLFASIAQEEIAAESANRRTPAADFAAVGDRDGEGGGLARATSLGRYNSLV